jgi:stearoyl-CoA desaturase (delta-9 desaturase)
VTETVRRKDWVNILFLTLTPVVGVVGTALYTWRVGFHPWMLVLFVTMYLLVGLSICAGYHRFFSHKSYEASPVVQVFFAVFGAMAAQNSILRWSSSHRIHHHYVDKDWDPYNIRRGFWWAHILWIFYADPANENLDNAADLAANPVVRWQQRWTKFLLLGVGFGLPTLVGALFGDPIAGLLWGGFLRIVVIHHTTFFVNSLAHQLGERRYGDEVSARDNWMVALLTLGEGYHSFHHRFPADFRNGIRWFHWDPAKWFIRALRFSGLASELRATPEPLIERARMQAAVDRLAARIEEAPGHDGETVRQRIAGAREALENAVALWKRQSEERARGLAKARRETRREIRRGIRQARRQWRSALELLPAATAS